MDRPGLTTRTLPPGTATPSSAPSETTPLVIPPHVQVPGRARGANPLRREGPDKLTGTAKYADDLVVPGAWFGATIRSTEPHARLIGVELDDAFDWKRVVVVTAEDIPGENVVSLIDDDQPVLVPIGGEIRHQAEPCALIAAAGPRHAARGEAPRPPLNGAPARGLRPARQRPAVRRVHGRTRRCRGRRDGDGRPRDRGNLSRRPPGAALHREPGDDRHAARRTAASTIHGSLQCPYYIHKAMKRALAMGDEPAVVVQAETGGGFGGKEEYPSIIALHAALLALKCGTPGADDLRPPRGHQRHHEASPGGRALPHRGQRQRRAGGPGDRGDHGRRCVLHPDPGRPVARRPACGRPVSVRERADHRARDGDEHAAERCVPRLRRAADRVRGRDAGQPRGGGARTARRSTCAGAGCTARATRRRPARCCASGLPASRCWRRRRRHRSSSVRRRRRARHASAASDRWRPARVRRRPGARLARRGLHRQRRGPDAVASPRSS